MRKPMRSREEKQADRKRMLCVMENNINRKAMEIFKRPAAYQNQEKSNLNEN